MTNQILVLFLILMLGIQTYAQKVNFEFYTTEDGLAGNAVSAPIQDGQGFIWVTSSNGQLQKFDGRKFMTFPPRPDTLAGANEPIRRAISYQDSLLFIGGTYFVFLLNPSTQKWQSYPLPKVQGTKYYFGHMHSGKSNEIYIRTYSDTNMNRSNWLIFKNGQLENFPLESPAFQMATDYLGNYYVVDEDYLVKTTTSGKYLAKIRLPHNRLVRVQMDPNGDLLLFVHPYFYNVSNQLDTLQLHPVNRLLSNISYFDLGNGGVTNYIWDNSGNIWIGGNNGNLSYYDQRADTLYNFQKKLQKIFSNINDLAGLLLDQTGTIWASSRLGLLKINLENYPFDNYYHRPYGNARDSSYISFRGFTEDVSGYIYASSGHGLTKIDPFKKRQYSIVSTNEYNHRNPYDLQAEGDKVWLNNGTLFQWSSKYGERTSGYYFNNSQNGVFTFDKNERLWWLIYQKVSYLDKSIAPWAWKEEFSLPVNTEEYTESFHLGQKSGLLWMGTQNRLFSYSISGKNLSSYAKKDWNLPIGRILALEETINGHLWMATDVGLVYFDPTSNEVLEHYTVNDGLSDNFICGLLTEGDSCLWLSTNHGLSRFSISNKTFINFFEEDGLTHNEFNRMSYFKASDGRMFFGGLRGFNAFYPEEVMDEFRRRNHTSKLILSSLKYVDENRDTTLQKIVLDDQSTIHFYHWDRYIELEYALTDYTSPQEVNYSYQMEGYENQWSEFSKANLTRYSSLPTGNFTFKVRARNHRGLLHPKELAVKVIVHPPWWRTWQAYLGYFLLVASLIYLIFYFLRKRWLLQNALQKEQEKAQRLKELDSFKSRLYTNLTHEFRTPLTVILGMVDQIHEHPKKHLKEGLQLIRRNGQQLLQLINQLLDLSKLEDKSFQLQLQQGDIISYLRYLAESFHTYANGKNLSLQFFTTEEALIMDYDPKQLKQIMTNLLSNAIKFTPSGGAVKVRASIENEQLCIEVSDTGIGIGEKDLPFIFDRFYQVDGSTTREGEGTGIGLAHTQELVKLMEGEIHVESILQKGTQLKVVLPVHQSPSTPSIEEELSKSLAPEYAYSPILPLVKGEPTESMSQALPHLLIVEDNPDVVTYLKACLFSRFQIEVAYNGAIGVAKALQHIPDIIVSDVMMPEKDGYQLCHELKNDERTSHIPIILLTAKADHLSKISGLKTGADAYLSKPFDREELLVRLERLFGLRQRMQTYFAKQLQDTLTSATAKTDDAQHIEIENAFLQKVHHILEQNIEDEYFGLPNLCRKIGMSRSQLFRKMKALTNTAPSDYIRNFRLQKAKYMLENTDLNVAEAAHKVGFKDPSYFSKIFREAFGILPSATSK